MRFRKRLAAALLAIVMVVTSVQVPSAVSYAAELEDSSSESVQEALEPTAEADLEGGSESADEAGAVLDDEERQEDSVVSSDDEVQPDESAVTDGDNRTEKMTEAAITEKTTEEETTEEETMTASDEEEETTAASDEEIVIEGELNGVYQLGGAPSDFDGTAVFADSNLENYLYQQMLKRTEHIDTDQYSVNKDEVDALVSGVLNEHPDLYFVNNQYSIAVESTNKVVKLNMTYDTGYDDAAFTANTGKALTCVTDGMSDFEKAAALHDYLAVNVAYDYDNMHAGKVPSVSHNAYGALVNGVSVCDGYALAYKYLLGKVGIESYMVTSDSMNHAWNMVKLDGKYYHVDVTWDDPSRDMVGRVRHTNMFCTDTNFGDHKDWKVTYGSSVVDYKATDTAYESAFWKDSTAPLVFSGSDCYYISKSGSLRKADFSKITDTGTEVVNIGRWSQGTGSYWDGAYSGLYMIKERLFYNDASSIYSIKLDGTDKKTEFTPAKAQGESIFYSAYRGGKVVYALHTGPNLTANQTVLTADIEGVGGSDPSEETQKGYDIDNLTYTYTTIDGKTVTSTADGSPKLLVFFKSGSMKLSVLTSGFMDISRYGIGSVDAYAIEINKATQQDLESAYGISMASQYFTFCYDTGTGSYQSMAAYMKAAGVTLKDEVSNDYFVVCYLDKNNRLQYVEQYMDFLQCNAETIMDNLRVYCNYVTYKITYELNGGSEDDDDDNFNPDIYDSDMAITLKAPVREGYGFDGWYKDAQFTQKVTEIPKGSTGDITLYAKWKTKGLDAENPEYTFTTLDDQTVSSKADGKPKVLFFFRTTCANCKLTNIDLTANIKAFSGVDIYAVEAFDKMPKDAVAEYKSNYGCDAITYCYDKDGTNYKTMWKYAKDITKITTKVTLPSGGVGDAISTPAIIYIDSQNRVQHGTAGKRTWTQILEDLRKYCGYDCYLINYELDNGKNNSENPEFYKSDSDTIILKDPVRGGYRFDGWYKDSAYTQKVTEIPKGSREDFTLYAKWTKTGEGLALANLDETFIALDDTELSSKADGRPKLLVFFYKGSAGAKTSIKSISEAISDFDGVDIYAIDYMQASKADISKYKDDYGCDGITFSYDTEYGNAYSLRDYLSAAGISSSDPKPPIICYIDEYDSLQWVSTGAITADTVLKNLKKYCEYPHDPEGTYKITYELDGGTNHEDNPATYTAETKTIVLKDAFKAKFIFDGWYKDAEFKEKVTEITQGSTGDITLYAKWRVNEEDPIGIPNLDQSYTGLDEKKLSSKADGKPKLLVFFNEKGESSQNTVKNIKGIIDSLGGVDVYAIESTYSAKAEVTAFKKNYGCDGIAFAYYDAWDTVHNYDKAMAYVNAAGLSKNMYFPIICYIDKDNKLQWVTENGQTGEDILENLKKYCNYLPQEKGTYNITYELDGGTNHSGNPDVYTSDTVVVLQDPVKKGYVFDGWYKDAAFKEKVTEIAKGSTGDITLYAKWVPQGTSEVEFKITFVDSSFVYNAKEQKPKVKVTTAGDKGKDITLKEGKDYKLSYQNNKDAGTAKVIVTGIGEYSGTVEESFIIKPAPLVIRAADMTILVGDGIPAKYEYEVDGLQGSDDLIKEPILICSIASTAQEGEYLITPSGADAGSNYVITYEDGVLLVTTEHILWKVTFDTQGHGKAPAAYTGVRSGDTIDVPVEPKEEGYRFGGWYKDPECTKAWDFEADIVEADIILYAKWMYVSSDGSFALQEVPDQHYTGKALKPPVNVYDGDTLLKAGKDYQLKYYNNINTNADGVQKTGNGEGKFFNDKLPYVEIIGKGNYTNTVKVNFNILKVSIGNGDYPAAGVVLKVNDQLTKSNSVLKPSVSLKFGKALKKDIDFELDIQPLDAKDSSGTLIMLDKPEIPKGATGEFMLTIMGKGNYEGSIMRQIYVADQDHLLKNAKITLGKNLQNVKYTGSPIKLKGSKKEGDDVFTVQIGEKILSPSTDYYVIPTDGSAGKAELVIAGKGNYVGRQTAAFNVKGTAFSNSTVSVDGIENKTYTGKAHTQNKEAVVTDKKEKKVLVYGDDYTIKYSKNINKGTATMTFIGNPKKGYTGTVKKTFKIAAVDISEVKQDSSMSSITVSYSKAGAKPVDEIILTSKTGARLRNGKDYTLKYTNNKAVTKDAKITVTGKGNYSGKLDVPFSIVKADLSGDNIVVQPVAVAYNEKKADDFAYTPAIKLKDGKAALAAGKDYKIEYLKNTQADYKNYLTKLEAGTVQDGDMPRARITAIDGSNYGLPEDVPIEVELQIYQTKFDKKKLSVQLVGDAVYTGGQVTPQITVSYDGKALKEGEDYMPAYGANDKAGKNKGSITITGLAPYYGGSVTVKFDISGKNLKY